MLAQLVHSIELVLVGKREQLEHSTEPVLVGMFEQLVHTHEQEHTRERVRKLEPVGDKREPEHKRE